MLRKSYVTVIQATKSHFNKTGNSLVIFFLQVAQDVAVLVLHYPERGAHVMVFKYWSIIVELRQFGPERNVVSDLCEYPGCQKPLLDNKA